MSGHMMYVWDAKQGNPSTIQQAISIVNQLENVPILTDNALIHFTEVLKIQANKLAMENNELFNNEEFVENFINKEQQINTAVLQLFLPMQDNFKIMQYIVETAKRTNVIIVDDRYGLLFLPSGQILPHDRASVYLEMCQLMEEDLDEGHDLPQKEMEFAAWIEPYLNKLFIAEGFKVVSPPKKTKDGSSVWITHEFKRDIECGYQELLVSYSKHQPNSYTPYDGGYIINIDLNIYLPVIEEIYQVGDFYHLILKNQPTFNISLPSLIKNNALPPEYLFINKFGTTLLSPVYFKAKVFELLYIYRDKIIHLSNVMITLKGINQVLNKDLYGWSTLNRHMHDHDRDGVKCLILAKLTNDPIFDELSETLLNPKRLTVVREKEKHQTEYAKLLKYLREEVKALV